MSRDAVAEGAVKVHVHGVVSPVEMSTWSAGRITAFFGGLAAVIEAAQRKEVSAMSDDPKEQETEKQEEKPQDEKPAE